MHHLYFSERARRRARRRARLRRTALISWLLTLSAAALGFTVPSPSSGLQLVSDLLSEARYTRSADTGIETTESAASSMRFRRKVFDERPTPSPSPTLTPAAAVAAPAAPAPSGSIVDIIYAAAAEYGVSGDWMVSIAECESGLDPNAYNPAGYHGLFQYDQTTWAGNGYGDIFDPVAQSRTTARLLAAGQSSRWPNCA
jgi:soluble lytic murein transglycosylase-like protein